jgi:hypothetical protein
MDDGQMLVTIWSLILTQGWKRSLLLVPCPDHRCFPSRCYHTRHSVPSCGTGSPLDDNAAIAKMDARGPSRHLNLEGRMAHAKESMASFKSKVASNNTLKLTASNVFTWIRDDIIKD